jgi:hypothetical protein
MLALGLGAACGDDDAGDSGGSHDGGAAGHNGGQQPSEPAAEPIDAAEGGEVESGGAAVAIPAGALAEDTEVTIDVITDTADLPDADNIASPVYDFGPDGTVFDSPVTLTIDFDGDVPDGMTAKLAWLDTENDEWVVLPDSEVSGNTVTATTDHFTPFAVIFTSAGQVAGSCGEIGATDCGGDLVGTWNFSLGCITLPDDFLVDPDTGEDPFAQCGGASLNAVVDMSGTIAFNEDGTYALNNMIDADITISIPKECIGGDMADCAGLENEDNMVEDAGDTCDVLETHTEMNDQAGTYEISGNTVTTTHDGEEGRPTDYCVQGDTLTVHIVDEDGTETVFQATRD